MLIYYKSHNFCGMVKNVCTKLQLVFNSLTQNQHCIKNILPYNKLSLNRESKQKSDIASHENTLMKHTAAQKMKVKS